MAVAGKLATHKDTTTEYLKRDFLIYPSVEGVLLKFIYASEFYIYNIASNLLNIG